MPPKNEIAKKYVKLEQREHCLQKPGMWIGSVDLDNTYNIWLLNQDKMEKRTCQYIPGLFKIFDEVINNAGDHYIRQKKLAESGQQVNLVKEIRVTIYKDTGEISVYNSGDGIDIAMHPEHNIYVPELIFGNMLTSTNYTDEDKTWSGLNGAGVKLCNIFSEYLEIETVDAERGKHYKQRFSANMSVIEAPKITACKKKPYTKITFKPDYSRFGGGMTGLSEDMYQVMCKRVYDLCAITDKDITIYFNDQKLEFKTFEKYVDLYLGSKSEHMRVYEEINDNWQVIAAYNDFGGFEQVSFVNGLLTIRGGKHVDYIQNQIVKKIADMIEKKCKGKQVKPQAIKDNIILFVKCTIINPSFDSQSKETLTTPVTKFGSGKIELSDKFIEKLYKSGIVNRVLEICAVQDEKALKKTDGKKRDIIRGIPKLEDANFAGTPKSKECLLLLCEGDSSASIALSGLAEIGRDKFGVFPLKGKVMNVKDVNSQKIADNEEIANIKKVLGLETGKKYESLDDLRYGGIMLMTDQDSVSGDTPLLLKRDNQVFIDTIDNIGCDWKLSFFKEYGTTNYHVWNDKGWTRIVHVMRHRVQKKLYRVITDNGIVDVTEDHSLLDTNAVKIAPGEIIVGQTELLHHFPTKFCDNNTCSLSKKDAFVFGFSWAKDPEILAYVYKNTQPSIVEILNAPEVIRTEFIKGYYTAKNAELAFYNIKYNKIGFEFKDKVSAQIIYYLLKSIGYHLKMHYTNKYVIEILNTAEKSKNIVRKIIDLGYTDDYVYDLETENHHFQCGIGSICGHNTDGFHIRGLIMNLFHSMWPSLIKDFEFIHCINTPIVKVRRRAEQISFYSLTDFENWKLENPTGWDIKYYKGLGTSTETEAKEWFKNMKKVTYKFTDDSNINLDLAFNKQRADDRKEWLSKYDRQLVLNYNTREISYEDFVNKELIHFSNYDVERSIPCVIDGLKISQRKILYSCFKRNLVDKEIKVAQLAAYVAENSAYHHGEVSLQDAIIGMAQDFVGSNNINLLVPSGNYGTRLHGGNDSAQPRYIYTLLTPLASNIFKKQDAQILNYLNDDGYIVEPEYYVPIIPMILVNGAQGIGTGFSTSIPCYNPKDIIALLKRMLKGEELSAEKDDLEPWYKGFNGRFMKIGGGTKLISIGVFQRTSATIIQVTELPVGYWTFKFKLELEKQLDLIKEFKKYDNASAGNIVKFTLYFTNAATVNDLLTVETNGLTKFENKFGLASPKGLNTSNMYAFNGKGQITKYATVFDIVQDFYSVRLDFYQKRKDAIIKKLREDMELMENKIRFIKQVVSETLKVHTMKKAELEDYLTDNDYKQHENKYDYIIRIPVYNLTRDKVEELEAEYNNSIELIKGLEATTPQQMWSHELEELSTLYSDDKNLKKHLKKK